MELKGSDLYSIFINLKFKIIEKELNGKTFPHNLEQFWSIRVHVKSPTIIELLFEELPEYVINLYKKSFENPSCLIYIDDNFLLKICIYILDNEHEISTLNTEIFNSLIKRASSLSLDILNNPDFKESLAYRDKVVIEPDSTKLIDPHRLFESQKIHYNALVTINKYCSSILSKEYQNAFNQLVNSLISEDEGMDFSTFKRGFNFTKKFDDFQLIRANNESQVCVDFKLSYLEYIEVYHLAALQKLRFLTFKDCGEFDKHAMSLKDDLEDLCGRKICNSFILKFNDPLFIHYFINKYNISTEDCERKFFGSEEVVVGKFIDGKVWQIENQFFIKIKGCSDWIRTKDPFL